MITFEIRNTAFVCVYTPEQANAYDILSEINKKPFLLRKTFLICKKDLVESETEDDICFKLGEIVDGYIKIYKKVLNTSYDVYFDKKINITRKFINYFIHYNDISILKKLVEVMQSDVYIDYSENDELPKGHISFRIFKNLVEMFPNTYELKKYTYDRISHLIQDCFERHTEYEKYLAKKQLANKTFDDTALIDSIKLDLLTLAKQKLEEMLNNYVAYNEIEWQENIKDIICIIFPKYLYALREVDFGITTKNKKRPDFTLIDSNGYIDVMEIKKPFSNQVMRDHTVRNNYVPEKLFTDIVVQTSKYIFALNENSDKVKKNILSKLDREYSGHSLTIDRLFVNNPKGIILFGRSNRLNSEQRFDFELIKRQYKDIPEIMTYDDLLERLTNLIDALS